MLTKTAVHEHKTETWGQSEEVESRRRGVRIAAGTEEMGLHGERRWGVVTRGCLPESRQPFPDIFYFFVTRARVILGWVPCCTHDNYQGNIALNNGKSRNVNYRLFQRKSTNIAKTYRLLTGIFCHTHWSEDLFVRCIECACCNWTRPKVGYSDLCESRTCKSNPRTS